MNTKTFHFVLGFWVVCLLSFGIVSTLSAATNLLTTAVFESSLDPTQEVPPAELSAHSGTAKLHFDLGSKYLSWIIDHTVWDATGAHIHGPAPPGTNADVIIDLGSPETPIKGGASLSEEEETNLMEGLLYINIHSPSFPDGDIRGQIVRSKSKYTSVLSGSAMVPPLISNGTGTAELTYDHTTLTLSFTITHNLTATGAFLNGPASETEVANTTFRFPRANSPITGTLVLNVSHEPALFENLYYINITTETNPYGELRGQVNLVEDTDENDFSGRMRWWGILLVVVAVVVAVAIIGAAAVFTHRYWQKKKDYKDQQKQFADPLLQS